MSRRPLYLVVPAILACAIGYVAWPSAPAKKPAPSAQAVETSTVGPARAKASPGAPAAVGVRARYELVFEHRAAINGNESAAVVAAGSWTMTQREGGDVEVAFAPSHLACKGDAPPSESDVRAPFVLKRHGGALLGVAFPDGLPARARDFLASVATALQWTDRPGDTWTVEEQDLTGKYQATYTRTGQRLRRERGAYTAMQGAGGLKAGGPSLQSHEDSSFTFDERGLVTASIQLDQTTALGKGLPTIMMRLRAKLVRQEVGEITLASAPAFEAEPIAPHIDHAAIARNRNLALVAGARAPELIASAKRAAHLDQGDPTRNKETSKALRRLAALAQVEPGAAGEVADAIRRDPSDIATVRTLAGALSSAPSPQATNALASLLGEPLPDQARATVLADLGLAASPTPESVDALTKELDKPLGQQAALALGSSARTLGDEGAGAVETLLARYEAAKTPADKLAYLDALANTGSRDVLPVMLAAIAGSDLALARVGAFGLRLIPGEDVEDALWGLIAGGSALTLEAVKATSYRDHEVWEPRLKKARELYKDEKRVVEAIQAVLTQWVNLKIAAAD